MTRRLAWIVALALAWSTPADAQEADKLAPFLKHPGRTFVLENARLIDGRGSAVREGVTVVLERGLITYVGAEPRVAPEGAERIDLTGHTVLPGLVMMHEHINYFSGAQVWDSQPGSVPKLLLAAGVTAARTAGSEAPQVDLNLKTRIDTGRVPGPRLFVTGAYLNGSEGGFLGDTVVRTAAEGRAVTDYWGDRGATSIKVYSAIPPEALGGAVKAANARGMHVAGHLGEISCAAAAEAGVHTIEHSLSSCIRDFAISPEAIGAFRYDGSSETARSLIALLLSKNVTLVATPPTTEPYEPTPEELSMLSPHQRERYQRLITERPAWLPPPTAIASWNTAHRAFEKDFVAAGGRLLIGADASDFGVVPGYANHNAIIALVRSGLPPLRVIGMATYEAATYLGVGDELGAVTSGRKADLLIVKGAPDQRIEDIRNVTYVFKDGRSYDSAKLRATAKGMLGLH